jgi:chlorobactene glucosyltransferase
VEFALSLAWAIIVAWLLWRAIRQDRAFERLEPAAPPPIAPWISVVIPARDEAMHIGQCVASFLAQTYPSDRLRIVVVDDHSADETAEIVRRLARRDARVSLVPSPPLPAGWLGKPHACWIGALNAGEPDWLCFVDADVRARPELVATAAAKALEKELDFVSLTPRQELVSFAERLVMPCGLYLLGFRQDLDRVQAGDSPEATATGQFILVRRASYEDFGGHAAVRDAICEDLELARRMKRRGARVVLFGGDRLLSTRMYTGWHSLWLGVSKNLVDMLGGPAATIATSAAVIVLAWASVVLPTVDAVACRGGADHACAALGIALTASVAAFAFHVAGAIFFAIPIWYGLLFPLGYTAGALMALDSVRRRSTGRVVWKGRTCP